MLEDRRRALHAAIVEAIEQLYADRLSEQVERLAYHAVRGRVLPKAVRYLREAGSKAVGRSANREAVAYLEEALAVLDELSQTTQTLTEALEIRMALGPALIAVKGAASPEVEQLYLRALELGDQLEASASRFPALWGLWYVNFTRGRYPQALEAGERLLDTARNGDDTGQLLEAHHALWPTLSAMGRPMQAIVHMEQGLALYDRDRHGTSAFLYGGHDPGACCRWHLAINRWLMGYPDRALNDLQDALRLAEEIEHPQTTVIALWHGAWVHCQRGERELAIADVDRLTSLAELHGISTWTDFPNVLVQAMKRERTSIRTIAEMHRQVASMQISAHRKVICICILAGLCAELGYAEEGLQVLRSIPEEQRGTFFASEILRLEGELLLKREQPALDEAKRRFHEAIGLARGREEKSLELRAATSLARLLDRQGRREEAHATLIGVYGWFTEGFDTADLKAAKALLHELSRESGSEQTRNLSR
jgi:tetratricopeptide (TPR) repeat protein